jgi:hypothetical protein
MCQFHKQEKKSEIAHQATNRSDPGAIDSCDPVFIDAQQTLISLITGEAAYAGAAEDRPATPRAPSTAAADCTSSLQQCSVVRGFRERWVGR